MKKRHSYTMNDYQADISEFMIYKWKLVYPILGLSGEAGEASDKLAKHIRDQRVTLAGDVNLTDTERAAIALELGDCLWMIAAAAKDLDLSLNSIAAMNIEKLRDRKKRGVISGSGDNR